MLGLFKIKRLSTLLALLSLTIMSSSLSAGNCYDSCNCNRFYIGGFGGGLYSNSTQVIQTGTAFFTEAEGGPLAVDARGSTSKTSTGFGGVQLGYEWSRCPIRTGCSGWTLTPAAEIEAFFYSHTKDGALANPTTRLEEHNFIDTLPMDMQVYLVNAVFSLNNSCCGKLVPYFGGGIGPTNICIRNATSIQTDPAEAVNHFNSNTNSSSWAFAAQVKLGLRYNIWERLHVFGEYRYLYVSSSNYIFGSTVDVAHAPTSTWNVQVRNICYNAFVFGLQYDL